MSAGQRDELRGSSDDLVEQLREIKAMETEKRGLEISTPEFHELAEEITEKSREIFRTASHEEAIGDDIKTSQGVSIDES